MINLVLIISSKNKYEYMRVSRRFNNLPKSKIKKLNHIIIDEPLTSENVEFFRVDPDGFLGVCELS